MNATILALRAVLKESLDNIDAGNTNISEEHANVLIDLIGTINKPKKRISKAFACEHILHINSNKFNYLLSKGVIPPGKHELGFHELSWSIADFDDALDYLKND